LCLFVLKTSLNGSLSVTLQTVERLEDVVLKGHVSWATIAQVTPHVILHSSLCHTTWFEKARSAHIFAFLFETP